MDYREKVEKRPKGGVDDGRAERVGRRMWYKRCEVVSSKRIEADSFRCLRPKLGGSCRGVGRRAS